MQHTGLSLSQVLTRKSVDYLHAKLDGEMVLMHIDSAEYYGMDKTTTHIWELLEEDMSLGQMVETLVGIYEVDYDTCKKEIEPVLEDMIQKDMVRLVSSIS